MKRIIMILFVAAFSTLSAQQENTEKSIFEQANKNELSLNLPYSFLGEYPEFTYERLLTPELGIGASAGFSLGDGGFENINYSLVPFARFYFISSDVGKPYQFGRRFFIEANSGLIGYENMVEYQENDNYYTKDENKLGVGLGLGIGYKYVNKSNWIGTLIIGAVKVLNNDGNEFNAYPRFGINIGKRF